MNKKMKKNRKQYKKPAFLVMGSTIALFTFAAPMMAHDLTDSKHITDSIKTNITDVKALPDVQFKSSTYIKEQAEIDNKKDKADSKMKAQTESASKSQAEANNGKANVTVSEDSDITDVSNTTINGKCVITFTVPEGKAPIELDFSSYKNSGSSKTIHGKTKGTYASGKHTVEVDLPQGADQCDLIISNNNKDAMNILWSREAGGLWNKSRKGQAVEAYVKNNTETKPSVSGQAEAGVNGSNVVVSGDSVITDVSNRSANGRCAITFTVPQGTAPVDLEFSSYKVSGSGKMIHAKITGTYEAGTHTVDVDLPKDTDQYDLLISGHNKDNSMNVLWNREAGGFWKALMPSESANVTANIVQKLIVTSTLMDIDSKTWSYKVKNPNNKAVAFNWMLEGTAKSGLKTIEAGEEITLTSVQGGTQNLLISVPGDQSYDIKVAAVESPDNQSGAGSNGSSPEQSGGSASSGGSNTSSTQGGTSAPGAATSNLSLLPGEQSGAAPASLDSAAPQTAVSDAILLNSSGAPAALNQASAARMSQLPQTGESLPFGLYALGALLILIGSFFIRKNKSHS
jgi:LPXTG-motif cell wall-anchored protein